MQLLPRGGIVDFGVFGQEFDFPVFFHGNRQWKFAIGGENFTPIAVALFLVMFKLLYESGGMAVQLAYVTDRGEK